MMGLDTVFRRVFGTRADRMIKKMGPTVARINALEPEYKALSEDALRGRTADFRQKLDNGEIGRAHV